MGLWDLWPLWGPHTRPLLQIYYFGSRIVYMYYHIYFQEFSSLYTLYPSHTRYVCLKLWGFCCINNAGSSLLGCYLEWQGYWLPPFWRSVLPSSSIAKWASKKNYSSLECKGTCFSTCHEVDLLLHRITAQNTWISKHLFLTLINYIVFYYSWTFISNSVYCTRKFWSSVVQ
jgi:hypothetical protein